MKKHMTWTDRVTLSFDIANSQEEILGHSDTVTEADAGILKQDTTIKCESRGLLCSSADILTNVASQLQIVQVLNGALSH